MTCKTQPDQSLFTHGFRIIRLVAHPATPQTTTVPNLIAIFTGTGTPSFVARLKIHPATIDIAFASISFLQLRSTFAQSTVPFSLIPNSTMTTPSEFGLLGCDWGGTTGCWVWIGTGGSTPPPTERYFFPSFGFVGNCGAGSDAAETVSAACPEARHATKNGKSASEEQH